MPEAYVSMLTEQGAPAPRPSESELMHPQARAPKLSTVVGSERCSHHARLAITGRQLPGSFAAARTQRRAFRSVVSLLNNGRPFMLSGPLLERVIDDRNGLL
jgi:hypothetical protein